MSEWILRKTYYSTPSKKSITSVSLISDSLLEDMKLLSLIGAVLLFVLVFYMFLSYSGAFSPRAPRMSGQSARLPCLANNHCPMGQACSSGFCSEGFDGSVRPSNDTSSCTAKECKGLNTTCSRKETPCPEGTFCQNDNCVNIAAENNGEAYGQIGMLL